MALGGATGCGEPHHLEDWVSVREVTPSFLLPIEASDPALAADAHGRVALTYVTGSGTSKDLWLSISQDSGVTFASAMRMNERTGSVASFPEGRPCAALGPSGQIAVAWAERGAADSSGPIDIVLRASGDGGARFGPPVPLGHGERPPDSAPYGLPCLTYLPDGSLFAAWFEGSRPARGPPVASLYGSVSPDGGMTWPGSRRLSDDACPCCRPVALGDVEGRLVLGYRRRDGDLLDPALAILDDVGRVTLDTVISNERWLAVACPAEGPALSASGPGSGRYAWYTGSGDAGVYVVAWRADRGAAGVPRRLDDSLAEARNPRLAAMSRATLVAVDARPLRDSSESVLAVRMLDEAGTLTPWTFLGAEARGGWIAGTDSRTALACWIERGGEKDRVRVARLRRR